MMSFSSLLHEAFAERDGSILPSMGSLIFMSFKISDMLPMSIKKNPTNYTLDALDEKRIHLFCNYFIRFTVGYH